MHFDEFDAALTPGPSPAGRERGVRRSGRGEGLPRPSRTLRQAARDLRRDSTHSEGLLWEALRDRKLDGCKFRRQHPVGPFILDFYCADQGLAVEIDGAVHDFTPEADAARQTALESLGIRFLRLPARLVESDREAAVTAIRAALSVPCTHLPSPAHGRGAGGEG